jgi:hypothetical protein
MYVALIVAASTCSATEALLRGTELVSAAPIASARRPRPLVLGAAEVSSPAGVAMGMRAATPHLQALPARAAPPLASAVRFSAQGAAGEGLEEGPRTVRRAAGAEEGDPR